MISSIPLRLASRSWAIRLANYSTSPQQSLPQQSPSSTASKPVGEPGSLATKAKPAEASHFDTHAFVSHLIASGYTQQQAEQLCYLFKDITNSVVHEIKKECVTKSSQELSIQQIMIHIGSLKKDMIILEKSEFSALRSENEKLALHLKSLRELINDEIVKLKGGFNLDINLEKNKTTEMKYDLENRIDKLNSRIDVEISAFRTILETFKSESVKYVAECVKEKDIRMYEETMTCEEELASMKTHRRERNSRSSSKKQSGCHFRPFSPQPTAKPEEFDDKLNCMTPITSFYEELDKYYKLIYNQIMQHQSLTTGLFPTYSKPFSNCKLNNVGHVRDTIYCALAVWSLRQCYSKVDDDKGRTHYLGQVAVKAMRGILFAWMRQAHRLEEYKTSPLKENALHCKFDLKTANEVDDKYAGHLQLDCVALYLVVLAQMISSGLQIIFSKDEVDFVQGLVFYIERAYRTPDYGMFERGSKYNNNECELHASSIGMVKAALESMNGFNLYGDDGCSWSVVYVDIDAHNRNRSTLETLLPRESSSKNTSASLIATIGFPAFSVHDVKITHQAITKCVKRLKGEYGFKRYLRDGANHPLEDTSKPFYEASEVKNFDGVENEYPVYFCYMMINNIFANNMSDAKHYYKIIVKNLLRPIEQDKVMPLYYYVPEELIEEERKHPGSQERLPSPEINEGSTHLWTQSIWFIARLLMDKLLIIQELDPIRRFLQPSERPRQSKRYSTFKGFYSDLTVNIGVIAESVRLQQMLANYGIQSQTPHQVEPIEIWPPGELVKAYALLGHNNKLNLTGRPNRPVGVLGTSKLYRICSQTVLSYPLTFETNDFYMSSDLSLLLDDVRNDISFLSKCWKLQGRPIYLFLIREQNLRSPQRNDLLELLSQFKQGNVNGAPVRLERLQTLVASACLEHLDFLDEDNSNLEFLALKELETDNSQYKSLSDLPKHNPGLPMERSKSKLDDFSKLNLNELIGQLHSATSRFDKALILHTLINRFGMKLQIQDSSIEDLFYQLANDSASMQDWRTVRYVSSLLHKKVDSLAPSITNILVRGKIITIGVYGQEEVEISKPLTPANIKQILYEKIFPCDIYQAVLMQELIINISKYISTEPEMFNGIMKLRLGWILEVMKEEIAESKITDPESDEPLSIEELSPNDVKQLLYFILTCNTNPERTIYQKRKLDGALNRVPTEFYENVWYILKKSPYGIKINGFHLPQQPTLSDMTDYELNFSIKVEEMLSKIDEPVFRQIVVELFVIIYTILCRNPELQFTKVIELDQMVNQAIELYRVDNKLVSNAKMAFFNEKPSIHSGTTAYLSRVCIESLLKFSTVIGSASFYNIPAPDVSCKVS